MTIVLIKWRHLRLVARHVASLSAFRLVPLCLALWLCAGAGARAQEIRLRVGHFPNITHVQALVAHNMSRHGQGWFEPRLGSAAKIEWFVYNAGPSAMEAISANSIDLTYAGPSPAINAYAKSGGEDIRIIAGAAEGGAALVVQPGAGLNAPADFRGKKIATPQLGNTQDVSARAWLTAGGLRITLTGGDAQVLPVANPDQLGLFKTKQVDAVWTVEPWVSRLLREADGKVLLEETDAITTVLVARRGFLDKQPDLARRFAAAHAELTDWVRHHPEQAQAMARDELEQEMHGAVDPALVASAWNRIVLTSDISKAALEQFVTKARQAGFLRTAPDLSRLVEKP